MGVVGVAEGEQGNQDERGIVNILRNLSLLNIIIQFLDNFLSFIIYKIIYLLVWVDCYHVLPVYAHPLG